MITILYTKSTEGLFNIFMYPNSDHDRRIMCKLGEKLYMVTLRPFSSYHDQNYSNYRSASVILICNTGYIIRICNLIEFGHGRLRKDKDFTKGQFCTQLTALYLQM